MGMWREKQLEHTSLNLLRFRVEDQPTIRWQGFIFAVPGSSWDCNFVGCLWLTMRRCWGFLVRSLMKDMQRFKEWETAQSKPDDYGLQTTGRGWVGELYSLPAATFRLRNPRFNWGWWFHR